eukprot:4486238-Pleurochrysis_carterae.AAC.1
MAEFKLSLLCHWSAAGEFRESKLFEGQSGTRPRTVWPGEFFRLTQSSLSAGYTVEKSRVLYSTCLLHQIC